MTIAEKIKAVVKEAFPEWTLIFGDWYEVDKQVNKQPLPAIVTILPNGGNIVTRNGRKYDTENNLIAFIDKVPKDASGEDNVEVYNRMKQAATWFIAAMNASGQFEPITSWSYTTIYEQLSDIVTGVMVQVQVTEARC